MQSKGNIYAVLFIFIWFLFLLVFPLKTVIHEVIALVLIVALFTFANAKFIKQGVVKTATGAVVMSSGIFISGAFQHFTIFSVHLGRISALLLLAFYGMMMGSYLKAFITEDRYHHHFDDPIGSFAVGTWVAATSVCGAVIFHELPRLTWIYHGMAVLDGILWLFFCYLCFKNFKRIFKEGLYYRVHGVLLLSTVSTESLVVFFSTMYVNILPSWLFQVFILIGLLFYVFSFALILKRYLTYRHLNVVKGWYNTNCILHGAMSITGLASILSMAVADYWIVLMWLWSLAFILIVEAIEIYRAIVRVRLLGWHQGLFTYDVSQWARNFTFGMFYTFTMDTNFTVGSFLGGAEAIVLNYGAWLIAFLFMAEVVLFFKASGQWVPGLRFLRFISL